jgi:hypothetical protein
MYYHTTAKPVNIGRPSKGETTHFLYRHVVFIWSVLCCNSSNEDLSKSGLYLQDGLYLEVVFITGLTIFWVKQKKLYDTLLWETWSHHISVMEWPSFEFGTVLPKLNWFQHKLIKKRGTSCWYQNMHIDIIVDVL